MLQKKVRRLFNKHVSVNQNRNESIESFTHDTSLVQSMKMLAASGVMDITVSDGNLIQMCGSSSYHQISVVRKRCDNATTCNKCTSDKWREAKADEKCQMNWDLQVSADSRTRWNSLSEAHKKERNQNNKRAKGTMKRKLKRYEILQKELNRKIPMG